MTELSKMDLSRFANSQEAQLNELELPQADECGLTEDQIEILLTFNKLTFAEYEGGKES